MSNFNEHKKNLGVINQEKKIKNPHKAILALFCRFLCDVCAGVSLCRCLCPCAYVLGLRLSFKELTELGGRGLPVPVCRRNKTGVG